jgi:hypothetical protein
VLTQAIFFRARGTNAPIASARGYTGGRGHLCATEGILLKRFLKEEQLAERNDRLRRAKHLRDAIVQRAQERNNSAADLARILGMSQGHWYRLKAEPLRLGRLTLERLETIAAYVGWPRVQVMVAIGWLHQSEIDHVISVDGVIQRALQRLEHGGLANGLTTPFARASVDHQVFMARLLIAAEAALTAPALATS